MSVRNVTGIGGFFFRADDPRALAAWYREHLGIDPSPKDYETEPWSQEAGPTVFAPFPRDAKGSDWMLNFRVRDLDALVSALRSRSIEVTVDPETYPNGRFAKLKDPEGNPIELWQPAVPPREAR